MPSGITIRTATIHPSIAWGPPPPIVDIRMGMVMNGPIPIMFDIFSAVACNSPNRRSRCGLGSAVTGFFVSVSDVGPQRLARVDGRVLIHLGCRQSGKPQAPALRDRT